MKKLQLAILLLICISISASAQKAKYVFFFIGDGMGLNQVQLTETYLGEMEGHTGIKSLLFPSFPYTNYATSYSASSNVTDSAAGGTALATGTKTYNGGIGISADTIPVNSIAVWAKNSGKKVGITTTVAIDNATPAVFYAHQKNRNMYYEIGQDLAKSGFDFFAGSDFVEPAGKDGDLHDICKKAGYTYCYGYEEAQKNLATADKMIMVQTKEAAKMNPAELPYAIDRTNEDLTLPQIVTTAVSFLQKDNKNGFFLMVEGGKIDHACHANDAASSIKETIDFDNAIKVAYDFYLKHPKETLIFVTADHETGGLALGNGKYELNLKLLQYQKSSVGVCTSKLSALRKMRRTVDWEDAKSVISECFGLFTDVKCTWREEAALRDIFETSYMRNGEKEKSLYQSDEKLATAARDILAKYAEVSWASGAHSDAYVPVYAVGVGAEQFHGRMNNTDIAPLAAKIAGYKK